MLFFSMCVLVCITIYLSGSKPSPLLVQLEFEEAEFTLYLQTFGKTYPNEAEYMKRFSIFRDNFSYIKLSNSLSRSYSLSINAYSDLTPEEFLATLTSPQPLPSSQTYFNSESLDIPNAVDWRTKNAVTPIKNQGNCACGYAFAATGAVEAAWVISGHSLISLSEQQILDCSANKGCTSGTVGTAFAYITTNGIANETIYPYEAKANRCNKAQAGKISAKISGTFDVSANNALALKTAVAVQPVAVAVDANPSIWQSYSQGTVSVNCGISINHYVLIVGYSLAADIPYYVIKNSWGVTWGMAGYMQIAIIDGTGVCGIQTAPIYPVV